MHNNLKAALTAFAIVGLASVVGGIAQADSNSLHKLGNAIQYPVRKLGENTSMAVHKAEGKKSIERDRKHDARYVVKPNGEKIYKGPNTDKKTHHKHHGHNTANASKKM